MSMHNHALDSLDWKLVNLLADDASRPAGVAHDIGITLAELDSRVENLIERGVLRGVAARVDPAGLGFPFTAFYALRVAQNADTYKGIELLIRDIDQVEEAHAISGQYDWLVKVRGQTVEDLQDILTHQLALLPGFVRAETMVVLKTACDHLNVDATLHPPG